MAAGKTVPVSFDDWVDLNTAAGVTVGSGGGYTRRYGGRTTVNAGLSRPV